MEEPGYLILALCLCAISPWAMFFIAVAANYADRRARLKKINKWYDRK